MMFYFLINPTMTTAKVTPTSIYINGERKTGVVLDGCTS